jgi:aspartate dehydrogenase
MKTIAVIGCGALSHVFAQNLPRLMPEDYLITGVMSRTPARTQEFAGLLGCGAHNDIRSLLASRPDFVVEFAGVEAVRQYAEEILSAGANLVVASVGAFADEDFKKKIMAVARQTRTKVYIPSGAIGGFDLMKTFALMGNAEVTIDDYLSSDALTGAPFLKDRNIAIDQPGIVFSGTPSEAIEGFPKNVNVAVATAMATASPNAKINIHCVPETDETTHRITLKNNLMHAELNISSRPDPENPRSSVSAAWNVLTLFKTLASPMVYF